MVKVPKSPEATQPSLVKVSLVASSFLWYWRKMPAPFIWISPSSLMRREKPGKTMPTEPGRKGVPKGLKVHGAEVSVMP